MAKTSQLLIHISITAKALGFPVDKKKTREKKESKIPSLGKGTERGAGVRAAVRCLVPSLKKGDCISVFAGSLAKNANISTLSLVP